jgi:hypothetical protein
MAKQIRTTIDIQAPVNQVWNVLTDFDSYPTWNPFIKWVKGEVKVGNQIEVQLPGMKFTPTVKAFTPYQEFSWLGHLGIKGLFDGKHIFRLEQLTKGTTRLHHEESFQGLLAGPILLLIRKDTQNGFLAFNEALRERVESMTTSVSS